MKNNKYFIAEVANVHGGDFSYLEELVEKISAVDGVNGIKFQPFKYDCIALPDFKWYPVYVELFFDKAQWKKIIDKAAQKLDIWIDTFDEYTIEIINDNLDKITGIKLQASIVYNENVFQGLKKAGLKEKKLILNISGLSLEEIKNLSERFKNEIQPKELILQIGYQSYPTTVEDSGLSKIKILQDNFPYEISFADHIDGKAEEAVSLPVTAASAGAKYIEKHTFLEERETKYDFQSSVTISTLQRIVKLDGKIIPVPETEFIVEPEKKYLLDSRQVPITRHEMQDGNLLSFQHDLVFRRSNLTGMTAPVLKNFIGEGNIISGNVEANEPLVETNFRKAKIAAVIACRLKSSRLKKKALLKIGDISSVEMCIKNSLRLPVEKVVLATSDLEEDAELENYTYSNDVIFHKGDPEDVIHRYLDILENLNVDVLVRITADMPYVSQEITETLLKSHFESGADYTRSIHNAVGTAPEIINVAALKKVKKYFPRADYSEYMTFYFMNNPNYFRINEIELPKEMVRDYRLTLDYQEDLDLFIAIENYLQKSKLEPSLKNIFGYLNANPEIAKMNSHITLKYKTDIELIKKLNEVTTIVG